MGENKVDQLCSYYDWLARLSASMRRIMLGRDVVFSNKEGCWWTVNHEGVVVYIELLQMKSRGLLRL